MSSESPNESSSENRSDTVCFLCRQRKTKCDRSLPKCGFCIKAKVECQYVAKPRKRGLRAGYVSELENRIERLEDEVSNLKDQQQIFPPQTPGSTITPHPTNSTPATAQFSLSTPSLPTPGRPPKRQRLLPESDSAVADLMTLPREYLYALVDAWFRSTQAWFPVLSRQQVQAALDRLPTPIDHIEDIVLRAVLSLEIAHSTQAITLGYHGRHRLSQYLRSQVLTEALAKASLSSLQASLIIALLDYGSDNISSTFGLLSICRRMCEHIGLFRKLLNQIELQSPAQVGPPSRDGGEDLAVPLTWATLALDAVSSLGVSWRDVSAALVDHLSSVAYVSTPDLRDSFKTHTHLASIGLQPVHQFIYDHEQGRYTQSKENALVNCDEIYHNLMSYPRSQPTTSYTVLADGVIDFDPNLLYTSILTHAAVILTYQRLVDFSSEDGGIPLERSLRACEDMVLSVRSISDADAEVNSPLFATMLFIAARFKLIMYRTLSQQRESSFDTLMHGINMAGRRWPVARRLDIVLRAAIVEVDTGNTSPLPGMFLGDGEESSGHLRRDERLGPGLQTLALCW